jgi:uncharacterized membrane protein
VTVPQASARLLYLDWLRGVAVLAMVMTHVSDSWTRDADKHSEPYFTLLFIGGIASSLFLFLAGVATAMSATSKGRQCGSARQAAAIVRRRGWEIFVLGVIFRIQAQVLGFAPFMNVFKVDMLNTMGLSIVAASWLWPLARERRGRLIVFVATMVTITMVTPLIRAAGWPAPLPDPLEAYLRPAGPFAAFPLFPWAGFLFAGVLVGDLVDAVRQAPGRQLALQLGIATTAAIGIGLAWLASFQPSIYPQAEFWHSSPTFFFIRLGVVALTVPAAWLIETLSARVQWMEWLQPLTTLGRSSLFVYWIHVEMVYGVAAEPLKNSLPLWGSLAGTAALSLCLYGLVLVKNRLLERYELRGVFRFLAPVIR